MGILLVVGVGVLIYGIIRSSSQLAQPAALPDPAKGVVLRLGLPAGTEVKSISATDRTLAVNLVIPGQGSWIYVVPLQGDGKVLRIAVSGEGR